MTLAAFLAAHLNALLVMGVLLVASGFFSGSETALFSLTRGQLHRLRQGRGASRLAASLMARDFKLVSGGTEKTPDRSGKTVRRRV